MEAIVRLRAVATALSLALISGCGSQNVEVIDLNRVLDVFVAVLDEQSEGGDPAGAVATASNDNGDASKPAPASAVVEDLTKTAAFLKRFADELNAAKLVSHPIGTQMNEAGAVEGFHDANKDQKKDSGESSLFTIEIDAERSRLIASDTHGYRRDHGYRPHFGLISGYMWGSMMNRQNGFYSGGRQKPNYGAMSMSSRNYHSSAVSSVNARTGTGARSRSGSGGFFSFGK